MLINEEIKLDYSDVLIRPKRSTMSSRGEVNLERTHKFLWSKKEWSGIPIMSANMDTVGTPSMHTVLSKHNMVTCPARHYLKNSTKEFKGKVIGITGTNGKTSSKQILSNLLNENNCHRTEGNKNNQIGVPFSLLSLNNKYNYSVIEMGTSEKGEIDILKDMVKPDICLLYTSDAADDP